MRSRLLALTIALAISLLSGCSANSGSGNETTTAPTTHSQNSPQRSAATMISPAQH